MLILIRLHNRPVPALLIPILNWVIVGGSMLRMRAIYIHRLGKDYQGMPSLGQQLFRFVVSIQDSGKLELSWCLGSHKGYLGHIVDVRFQVGPRWRLCHRLRFIGGGFFYRAWQTITYKLFSPSREEHRHMPYWEVK